MSVNGSGKDRRTNKSLSDSTSWAVQTPAGKPVLDPKTEKPIVASAAEAFAAARSHRSRTGEYVVAVRK